MSQKGTGQDCAQILDFEFGGSLAKPLAGKTQEQSKGVPIAGNRVGTRFHLGTETVGEKFLKQGLKCRVAHGRSSFTRDLTALWEASSSNSGTA
jgi:hypothetical protein